MRKIKYLLATIFTAALFVPVVGVAAVTDCSATPGAAVCQLGDGSKATTKNPGSTPTLAERIKTIVNILLFILGAIAVIVIVISGIRYATSGGDANAVKGAKDTILYAVVGLIIAILAYAIVGFILGQF